MLYSQSSSAAATVIESRRFTPYSMEAIRTEPLPEWLVDEVLTRGGLAVIYGPSGHGKTFVTLDLCLSLATGRPWQGHDTTHAPVVYVSGEGAAGIRVRVDAWERHHGCQAGAFFVVKEAVSLTDEWEVSEFISVLGRSDIGPKLIVFDTLARCFGGGDENSAQDMGKAIGAVAKIQREFDCAVVLVHHSGRQGGHERGSTALRGAADTMLTVTKDKSGIRVKCDKQKDGEEMEPLMVQLEVVGGLGEDAKGRPLASCVVVGRGSDRAPARGPGQGLTAAQAGVLRAFPSGDTRTTTSTWTAAAGVHQRTFFAICKDLAREGFVERPRKGTYALTPKGTLTLEVLQGTASTATGTGFASAATASPRRGEQCSSSPQWDMEQV